MRPVGCRIVLDTILNVHDNRDAERIFFNGENIPILFSLHSLQHNIIIFGGQVFLIIFIYLKEIILFNVNV